MTNFLLLRDDTKTFRTIESGIPDLSLERKMRNLCHVKIFHFEKFLDWLQSEFESKDTFCCNVTELPGKESFIIRDILVKLISELKTLVNFDF